MVDDHTSATAAHCVYDGTNNKFIDFSITLTDCMGREIVTMKPKYVHVPLNYINKSSNYDYALVEVENNLSEYGLFKFGVATNDFIINNSEINVCGYPQYDFNGDGKSEWGAKYKSVGNIISDKCNDYRIYYNADTSGGSSGGSVYVEREYFGIKYKTVIAIHTNGSSSGNSGIRMTSDLLKFYYSNPEKKIS